MDINTKIKITAVQLGGLPSDLYDNLFVSRINDSPNRESLLKSMNVKSIKDYNLERILHNIKIASNKGTDLIVFSELALSSFFPYFYTEQISSLDAFFEEGQMDNNIYLKSIYDTAREFGVAVAFGYAEKVSENERYSHLKTKCPFSV